MVDNWGKVKFVTEKCRAGWRDFLWLILHSHILLLSSFTAGLYGHVLAGSYQLWRCGGLLALARLLRFNLIFFGPVNLTKMGETMYGYYTMLLHVCPANQDFYASFWDHNGAAYPLVYGAIGPLLVFSTLYCRRAYLMMMLLLPYQSSSTISSIVLGPHSCDLWRLEYAHDLVPMKSAWPFLIS